MRALLYLVKRYDSRYQAALAHIRGVMAPSKQELDDPSAEFLARLRGSGGLRDADWQHVLGEIPAALEFLARPNTTVTQEESGQMVVVPDANPT